MCSSDLKCMYSMRSFTYTNISKPNSQNSDFIGTILPLLVTTINVSQTSSSNLTIFFKNSFDILSSNVLLFFSLIRPESFSQLKFSYFLCGTLSYQIKAISNTKIMELKDLCWLVAFLMLLSLINLLYFLMVKSLREKPLGVQTIFDQALQDTFFIGNFFSSWMCLANISTRFEQSLFHVNQES